MTGQSAEVIRRMQAVDAAARRGDSAAAIRLAGEAAEAGADRLQILVLASFDSLNRDMPEAALDYAMRAKAQNRHDPEAMNAVALALSACGRGREAIAAFDAALRLAPGRANLHYNKGCALDTMGLNTRARLSFERAVALQPNYVPALARLAHLAAERGDFPAARSFGERALALQPREPTALLALAAADVGEKKFEAALMRVKPFSGGGATAIDLAIAQGITADALDGLGRHDEAFAAYADSNRTLLMVSRDRYGQPGREGACGFVERLCCYFRDAPADAWRARKTVAAGRTHVFLVGFPRSGTTLLEQVLAAHPDVETMDERNCLIDAENEFCADAAGLDRLAGLSGAELERWRKIYWQRVAGEDIAPSKAAFVDKLPLNTVLLPVIAKFFPDAKILFALRDPADVVWSCFRRRFGLNAQMYEFLGLESAARYYRTVMDFADICREKLGLDWYDTVYEKTVGDFAAEMRKVCAFLGLEWTERLKDFAAGSRARAPNTPSGPQVAQGLYAGAVGQWTAYRQYLEPVLPILQPWRTRLGYV
jgi:Tfp pilus assembly protein PilF